MGRDDAPAWQLSGFGDEIDPELRLQLAVLLAVGARHIEVRSAWGVNVVEWDDALRDRAADEIAAAGVRVSAVASPVGKAPVDVDPDRERARLARALTVAQRLGAPYVRVFSFFPPTGTDPAAHRDEVLLRMELLARDAQRAGIVLLHENEKDIYGDVPERVLDVIDSVGSDHLRVAWDAANFVQVGVRPFHDAYPLLRPHIAYLQVKDAVAATGVVVPAGAGDGQLPETLGALRDDGYAGFASLEPHLSAQHTLGGFSGPSAFGTAARAFAALVHEQGVRIS